MSIKQLGRWVVVMVAPLLFACAHATVEGEEIEAAASQNPALQDPETAGGYTLAQPMPEATELEIQKAQERISKKGHKKINHPFSPPSIVAKKKVPHKKIAQVVAVQPVAKSAQKSEDLAVQKNGSTLNRYYFFRPGDSAESLSKMFYGVSDRAAELVEWNGPTSEWQPGSVLYYRSKNKPDDSRLLSFYKEAGTPTQEIRVESGENLKTIAKNQYGSAESWTEIASLNGMKSEAVAGGTKIKVYPFPLVKAEPALIAQMDPVVREPARAPVAKEPKLASSQLGSFIQHNPLLVACSLVVLILFSAFFIMQRRRYRSRFDF